MTTSPSTNGYYGNSEVIEVQKTEAFDRDSQGRFQKGNKFGTGNPHANKVAALRSAFLNAVTHNDLEEVVATLVNKAKSGDVAAIKLLLNYSIGNPDVVVNSISTSSEPLSIEVVFV